MSVYRNPENEHTSDMYVYLKHFEFEELMPNAKVQNRVLVDLRYKKPVHVPSLTHFMFFLYISGTIE